MGPGERFHSWSLRFSGADAGHDEPMRLIRCDNQNRFSFVSAVISSVSSGNLGFGRWLPFDKYRHIPLLFCMEITTWSFISEWWEQLSCLKFDASWTCIPGPRWSSEDSSSCLGTSTPLFLPRVPIVTAAVLMQSSGPGKSTSWPMRDQWAPGGHLALSVCTEILGPDPAVNTAKADLYAVSL